MTIRCPKLFVVLVTALALLPARGQFDPATEPSVLAVARTLPAVVNINTERVVRRTVADPYDDFFNNFFGGSMRPSRTIAQKVQSLGSGFIIDAGGYIVTNEHVVERAAELKISVTTQAGKTYSAQYVTGSADTDLALLKIEAGEKLPFIALDDLSPNLLGQTVLVLGNPVGYGSSVARGILSAKNRAVTVNETEYQNLLQTDAAINPGNSGGPVVDLAGKLVGVSSVKMAFTPQGVPTQGLGFAVPGEVIRDRVAQFRRIAATKPKPTLREEDRSRAWKYFGLQLQEITPKLAAVLGTGSGVLVADVDPASPADEAGMKQGLIIHQIGRYPVTSVPQIEELLAAVDTGSVVDFTLGLVRRVGGRNVRQVQTASLTAR